MGYSRPGNSVEQDRLCLAIAPVFFPSKDNLLSILLQQSQFRKTQQPCVPLHPPPSPTKSDRIRHYKRPLNFRCVSLPSVTRHPLLISVYSQALPLNCCACVIQNHCLHAQDTSLPITKAGPWFPHMHMLPINGIIRLYNYLSKLVYFVYILQWVTTKKNSLASLRTVEQRRLSLAPPSGNICKGPAPCFLLTLSLPCLQWQLFLSFIPHKDNKWVYMCLQAVGRRRSAIEKAEREKELLQKHLERGLTVPIRSENFQARWEAVVRG